MIEHSYYGINEIKKGPFRYVLSIGPIDWFHYSLTFNQVVENMLEEDAIENLEEFSAKGHFVRECVEQIEESPHTVRYLGIPNEANGNQMDLAVIAKISNNGTCFIFSNNRDYLEFLNRR